MFDNTFEIVFIIFLISGFIIRLISLRRVPEMRKKRLERKSHSNVTRKEMPIMVLSFIGMQILPLVYVLTPWLDFLDYKLPIWAGWSGAVVFAIGLWLLYRSHTDLGCNFSPEVEIKEEHALVTNGVFRYIRHPMYAAHGLWAIAQALLLQNWIAGPAFIVPVVLLYLVRVPREEKMMLEHFGEEYQKYMNQTGRVIPRLFKL